MKHQNVQFAMETIWTSLNAISSMPSCLVGLTANLSLTKSVMHACQLTPLSILLHVTKMYPHHSPVQRDKSTNSSVSWPQHAAIHDFFRANYDSTIGEENLKNFKRFKNNTKKQPTPNKPGMIGSRWRQMCNKSRTACFNPRWSPRLKKWTNDSNYPILFRASPIQAKYVPFDTNWVDKQQCHKGDNDHP